jgi:hypothetical protein
MAGTGGSGDATGAYNIAKTALETSWYGTSTGHEAYDIGRAALDTSWVGTGATGIALAAQALASSAFNIATVGTISHSTLSASAGTVTFSMSGSAYQSCVIAGNTAITVTNIEAPTQTYIQAITARVHNNSTGSNFTLFWDAFGILGSTPPGSVTDNHSVFASFTSYGTSVQNVFLATASHV